MGRVPRRLFSALFCLLLVSALTPGAVATPGKGKDERPEQAQPASHDDKGRSDDKKVSPGKPATGDADSSDDADDDKEGRGGNGTRSYSSSASTSVSEDADSTTAGSSTSPGSSGNVSCSASEIELKIDSTPTSGSYSDGVLTVTISDVTASSFRWTSNLEIESVLVKGGPVTQSNPGGTSGTAWTAFNPKNGGRYGISHVSICYSPLPAQIVDDSDLDEDKDDSDKDDEDNDTSDDDVLAGTTVAGNLKCEDGLIGFKIDSAPVARAYSDGLLVVTISEVTSSSFAWTSNLAVDAVLVKGGSVTQVNAGGTSGIATTAINPSNDSRYGTSHVEFCYAPLPAQPPSVDDNDDDDDDTGGSGKGKGPCDADATMDGIQPCNTDDDDDDDTGGSGKGKSPCDADATMDGIQPCNTDGKGNKPNKGKSPCDADATMDGIQPCALVGGGVTGPPDDVAGGGDDVDGDGTPGVIAPDGDVDGDDVGDNDLGGAPRPGDEVLDAREFAPRAPRVLAEAPTTQGAVQAFTGFGLLPLLVIAFSLIGVGIGAVATARSRRSDLG